MPCHLAPAERWRWRWRCRLWGAPRVPGAVRNLLGTVSGGVGLDDLEDVLDVLDDVFSRAEALFNSFYLIWRGLDPYNPPHKSACIHKYYQIISNLIYSNMM